MAKITSINASIYFRFGMHHQVLLIWSNVWEIEEQKNLNSIVYEIVEAVQLKLLKFDLNIFQRQKTCHSK